MLRGARCFEFKYYPKVLFIALFLETFVFPTVIQPDIFDINPIFGFEFLDPCGDHVYLVTLSLQEKTVATVTEFINHNQPMPFPTHTFMFE